MVKLCIGKCVPLPLQDHVLNLTWPLPITHHKVSIPLLDAFVILQTPRVFC
jgi:hypothetical protein